MRGVACYPGDAQPRQKPAGAAINRHGDHGINDWKTSETGPIAGRIQIEVLTILVRR